MEEGCYWLSSFLLGETKVQEISGRKQRSRTEDRVARLGVVEQELGRADWLTSPVAAQKVPLGCLRGGEALVGLDAVGTSFRLAYSLRDSVTPGTLGPGRGGKQTPLAVSAISWCRYGSLRRPSDSGRP